MPDDKPGHGLFGWLGRQFGHIKRAVKTDVATRVLHRQKQTQEAQHPQNPDITLRRTVIDEVIVEKKK